MRARFNAHLDELIEPAIADRRGRIVKTTGDALLVELASVVDASIQPGKGAEFRYLRFSPL
jgi:class 3 adenylate cyclase